MNLPSFFLSSFPSARPLSASLNPSNLPLNTFSFLSIDRYREIYRRQKVFYLVATYFDHIYISYCPKAVGLFRLLNQKSKPVITGHRSKREKVEDGFVVEFPVCCL
uniref:Uncharacterized protein n=1 Tax=Salix viminalis TaxID=40686 RepID=A0A6N2NCN0_SALVM